MPSVLPRVGLSELMEQFNCEIKCREYLESLRWPEGPACPKCGKKEIARVVNREAVLRCKGCQTQFSVTAGTVFNDSHLPLAKWFIAVFLLCESKKGVSALQIQRILKIGGYKTAWYLCHRIRSAMAEASKPKLSGQIEMDETYVGGRGKGLTQRGRGTKKLPVLGIRQRNGELRMFHAEDVTTRSLEKFLRESVSDDVEVFFTDELTTYRGIAKRFGFVHKAVSHSTKEYVRGEAHTNTIESAFSLFKRGLRGSWHKISAKHLQAYLEEMCFRFNRRNTETLFQDTLRQMVNASTLTFEALTKESAA